MKKQYIRKLNEHIDIICLAFALLAIIGISMTMLM